VRRHVAIVSLLFAWLCANGAVWDVAQIFAWARMFTGYTQTLSVTAALTETFDASKPCDLCLNIAKAKAAEQKQAPQTIERSAEKIFLACETPAKILLEPAIRDWADAPWRAAVTRTEAVPVPPPRA